MEQTEVPAVIAPNSFQAFTQAVHDSVTAHAKRKGYTKNEVDGQNDLIEIDKLMGTHVHHCIAEIVYKAKEYLSCPRRVLLEKIAGWSFILWRETNPDSPPSTAVR